MTQPTLSIVLTVFNMEACLVPCLESLRNQTYRDYELICVDDGSSDGSREILESYAANDTRLSLRFQENQGAAHARNVGLEKAAGTYVMLLDSDDVFEPTLFETMVVRAQHTQADVVVCQSRTLDHHSGISSPLDWAIKMDFVPQKEVFSALDMKGCVFYAFTGWPWDKLYRTQFLRDHDLKFPLITNSEDLLFVYLALVKAQGISVVEEELIYHRINRSGSIENSRVVAPLAFYEGIEMLKAELQKDMPSYQKLEWGFLNWAFDYTCWNISSLPRGEEREALIDKFFQGKLSALEMDAHDISYYSLSDLGMGYYRILERGRQGKRLRQGLWAHLESLFRSFDRDGFSKTFRKAFARAKRR
ncbi:MAG: glycosyltransferase [Coriobacteriaceae bacterium]|nr:glycosyltransferase [Coriobacteriaceae bacterium]